MRSRCSAREAIRVRDQSSHGLVVAQQCTIEVGVPLGELGQRGRERGGHVGLGEAEDPIDDLAGSHMAVRRDVGAGHEWLDDHPPSIRTQADLRSGNGYHARVESPGPQA